jgi:adenylylsulfate kinase
MPTRKATNITWHSGQITREERWKRLGRLGATVWFTGLSGSGKSTVASALEAALLDLGINAYRLDGDNVRHGLNSNLGFSAEDRSENIRRVGEVAKLFADSGAVALAAFISPYRSDRDLCRKIHEDYRLPFFEVFIDAPLAVCEQRDPKGLYRKARAGEIRGFTGIDDPYERPERAELVLSTDTMDVSGCVGECLEMLRKAGVVTR